MYCCFWQLYMSFLCCSHGALVTCFPSISSLEDDQPIILISILVCRVWHCRISSRHALLISNSPHSLDRYGENIPKISWRSICCRHTHQHSWEMAGRIYSYMQMRNSSCQEVMEVKTLLCLYSRSDAIGRLRRSLLSTPYPVRSLDTIP